MSTNPPVNIRCRFNVVTTSSTSIERCINVKTTSRAWKANILSKIIYIFKILCNAPNYHPKALRNLISTH